MGAKASGGDRKSLGRAAKEGILAGLALVACASGQGPSVSAPMEPATPLTSASANRGNAPTALIAAPPPRAEKDCCNGKNDCKGKSGCANASNDCRGKNECKGQGTSCEPDEEDDAFPRRPPPRPRPRRP